MSLQTPMDRNPAVANPPNRLDRWARGLLQRRLMRLDTGRIVVRDAEATLDVGEDAAPPALCAQVAVHRSRFYRRLLTGGSLGAAAAYLDGDWDCDNLAGLFRATLRGLGRNDLEGGSSLAELTRRWGQAVRRNTPGGSRRNVRDHYDLGNDLFALFLDRTLTYSCGLFPYPGASLEAAQRNKLDRICRKLDLGPGDQVLEIGTGWGSFALHAAGQYGCHVTTTTLSPAQYEAAAQRVTEAGLQDRVTLLQKDYRELAGRFDKLVAIEMVEAVGQHHLEAFFRRSSELLDPAGRMLLQFIATGEQYYPGYRRSVDFIRRYVFPGSHCPSLGALVSAAGAGSDLRLTHLEDLTPHYAETLRTWRERFRARLDDVRRLGYSERFIRLWDYYLQYCEAGFEERHIAEFQVMLARSGARAEEIPPTVARPWGEQ